MSYQILNWTILLIKNYTFNKALVMIGQMSTCNASLTSSNE